MVGERVLANVEEATTEVVVVPKTFSRATKLYIYGQDLGTVLRYCSLSSSLKIQPCGFFLMGWKCIF